MVERECCISEDRVKGAVKNRSDRKKGAESQEIAEWILSKMKETKLLGLSTGSKSFRYVEKTNHLVLNTSCVQGTYICMLTVIKYLAQLLIYMLSWTNKPLKFSILQRETIQFWPLDCFYLKSTHFHPQLICSPLSGLYCSQLRERWSRWMGSSPSLSYHATIGNYCTAKGHWNANSWLRTVVYFPFVKSHSDLWGHHTIFEC